VSDSDLRDACRRAALCTLLCTADLQSLASLESMSASTPGVLANALALPHLVAEGVNGYLFEAKNPPDMAQKIATVLGATSEERHAMGQASHKFASAHAHEKIMDIIFKMY